MKTLESGEMESRSDGDCPERDERRKQTHWRERREESKSEREVEIWIMNTLESRSDGER